MKRLFIMAVAATAMLTACEKTDIIPAGDAQEISFVAVNQTSTKVPVDNTTFLNGDNMAVAAYIVKGAEEKGNFFNYTLFSKTADNTWSGNPARYWPLTTSTINFLAVTETGGGVDKTDVKFNSTNYAYGAEVVLKDNCVYNQNDLMFAAGQGTHTQGSVYDKVNMTFKHALAWINFTVKTATPAAGATTGCTITVNSITLNNANFNGTLNLVNTNFDKEENVTTGDITATWDLTGMTQESIKVPNSSGNAFANAVTLNNEEQLFGNGLLVVPDGYAKSFTINYTLTQGDGTANNYNYTYYLPTPTSGTKAWEMAKKYFYNINITLTEVLVKPGVAKWEDQSSNTPLDGIGQEEQENNPNN